MNSPEQIVNMPRSQLRESPFNPRKKYNQTKLMELAETMALPHGRIHSPLVVRPLDQTDIEYTHEIVFGHRRFRAAALAGRDDVPVIVREMTDEEVRVAQLIENAQREDVTPLEEADSLNELRHKHQVNIEDLMERTGKSRSYVFAALKLAVASEELRKAVEDRVVGGEVAKLLATVPNPLQAKALGEATHSVFLDGQVVRQSKSFRQVKDIVDQRYRLNLKKAPFDTLNIRLLPATVACDACPKRSDREQVLLEQCGPDICTDPDCFAVKSAAQVQLKLAEAKDKGQPVIEGDAAKRLLHHSGDMNPKGFTPLTLSSHLKGVMSGKVLSYADLLANAKESGKTPDIKPTLIEPPFQSGVVLECLSPKDAEAVLKANGHTAKQAAKPAEEANTPGWLKAQRKRDAEAAAAYKEMPPEDQAVSPGAKGAWNQIKEAIMRRVADTARSTDELRLVLLTELELASDFGLAEKILGWTAPAGADRNSRAWRAERVKAMSADELAALLVMVTIDRGEWMSADGVDYIVERKRLAEVYGVNVLDPSAPAPTPSEAARCAIGREPEAIIEEANASAPTTAATPAPKAPDAAKKPGATKYRNPLTGETWSGRGLQPKWLKAAISGGKRLDDFVVPTPSVAARAPAGGTGKAPVKPVLAKATPKAVPVAKGIDQAGSAGKFDKGAGVAGASGAAAGALEPAGA